MPGTTDDREQGRVGSQDVATVFDVPSEDFAHLRESVWEPVAAATIAQSRPIPGAKVLDACCGDGATALPAARQVGTTGRVDAVDLSAGLVGVLRARAVMLPQLVATAADVTTWDRPGGYDMVQCALGVCDFPDVAAGTDHLVGLARPGGRVTLTVWRQGALAPIAETLAAAVAEQRDGAPAPAVGRPTGPVAGLDTVESFTAWLGERGLRDVRVTEARRTLELTADLAWHLVIGTTLRELLAGLSVTKVVEARRGYLRGLAAQEATNVDLSVLVGTGTR